MARPLARCLWIALAAASVSACAGLPAPVERPAAHALQDPAQTPLGQLAERAAPAPNLSGFRLLASGEDALGALLTLADQAQRTLDLQYYLIKSDRSSTAILRRVRAAADRGVHVRLLLDDLNTAGQDQGLLALTAHPNIEVRLFNPFAAGRFSTVSRVLASLTDFDRINHRMHNKMFVADNALAVAGGRNLGDTYFVRSKESNFLDVDLIVAGPAVRALSRTFDRFWNDRLAYPVSAVASAASGAAALPAADAGSQRLWARPQAQSQIVRQTSEPDGPPSAAPSVPPLAQELAAHQLKLVWAPWRVLADTPSKTDPAKDALSSSDYIADDIEQLIGSARRELVLISPYFVPGQRGVDLLARLHRQGVQVRVLTNSLATTDAPVVHIGYARYRRQLLEQGIELYELRTRIQERHGKLGAFGSSHASLHAKVVLIDGQTSLVGSMNLDPRSARLNSEMGLLVRSPVIGGQLHQLFDEVRQNSYRLALDDEGALRWIYHDGPRRIEERHEPEASWWLRLKLKLLALFAPEEML